MKHADKILWGLLVLVLLGTITNTFWLFDLREPKAIAAFLALGIEGGIAGVVLAIRWRKSNDRRPGFFLWFVLTLCIAVSIGANFAHAVAKDVAPLTDDYEPSLADFTQMDALHLLTSILVSLPLPCLTFALAETVADNAADAQALAQIAREQAEEARKAAEEKQRREEAKQERTKERATVAQIMQTLRVDEQKARAVLRAVELTAQGALTRREISLSCGIPDSTLRGYLTRLEQASAEEEQESAPVQLAVAASAEV